MYWSMSLNENIDLINALFFSPFRAKTPYRITSLSLRSSYDEAVFTSSLPWSRRSPCRPALDTTRHCCSFSAILFSLELVEVLALFQKFVAAISIQSMEAIHWYWYTPLILIVLICRDAIQERHRAARQENERHNGGWVVWWMMIWCGVSKWLTWCDVIWCDVMW